MLMRFKESPEPADVDPAFSEKVMHSTLRIGDSIVMASDGRCNATSKFDGFSLSLSVPDETEARRAFAALADGGNVHMPLAKTFWSPCFGMLEDRFGVGWMVTVPGEM